jgi:glycosyltransferase involved in cell wall biosynthesis
MRILYCIPSLHNSGGMERVLSLKVNYLIKKEVYEITIITTDQKNKPLYYHLDKKVKLVDFDLNYDDHFNQPLIKKYFTHKKKQKKYFKLLESYLQNNPVDICISLCGKEIDFLYKLRDGSKKMAELHFSKNFRTQFLDSTHKGKIWYFLGKIRTKKLEIVTKRLSQLIVLTKEDKKEWDKTHSNVIQIYNPQTATAKEKAKLDSKSAIAVGRLDSQKGFDYLIDIWAIVTKKHPDWILNIWGGGIWEDMLNSKIKENKLENKVFLRGVTNDIQNEYLNNSLYLMTSRFEGFPMVLIEASSVGLPLISFNCKHGPSEIIIDGYNGYLVDELDYEGMVERISYLIENESARRAFGQNAYKNSQEFSIDTIMYEWIKLFNV